MFSVMIYVNRLVIKALNLGFYLSLTGSSICIFAQETLDPPLAEKPVETAIPPPPPVSVEIKPVETPVPAPAETKSVEAKPIEVSTPLPSSSFPNGLCGPRATCFDEKNKGAGVRYNSNMCSCEFWSDDGWSGERLGHPCHEQTIHAGEQVNYARCCTIVTGSKNWIRLKCDVVKETSCTNHVSRSVNKSKCPNGRKNYGLKESIDSNTHAYWARGAKDTDNPDKIKQQDLKLCQFYNKNTKQNSEAYCDKDSNKLGGTGMWE